MRKHLGACHELLTAKNARKPLQPGLSKQVRSLHMTTWVTWFQNTMGFRVLGRRQGPAWQVLFTIVLELVWGRIRHAGGFQVKIGSLVNYR
eukprot:2738513-Amphidinium_carterae.1